MLRPIIHLIEVCIIWIDSWLDYGMQELFDELHLVNSLIFDWFELIFDFDHDFPLHVHVVPHHRHLIINFNDFILDQPCLEVVILTTFPFHPTKFFPIGVEIV